MLCLHCRPEFCTVKENSENLVPTLPSLTSSVGPLSQCHNGNSNSIYITEIIEPDKLQITIAAANTHKLVWPPLAFPEKITKDFTTKKAFWKRKKVELGLAVILVQRVGALKNALLVVNPQQGVTEVDDLVSFPFSQVDPIGQSDHNRLAKLGGPSRRGAAPPPPVKKGFHVSNLRVVAHLKVGHNVTLTFTEVITGLAQQAEGRGRRDLRRNLRKLGDGGTLTLPEREAVDDEVRRRAVVRATNS